MMSGPLLYLAIRAFWLLTNSGGSCRQPAKVQSQPLSKCLSEFYANPYSNDHSQNAHLYIAGAMCAGRHPNYLGG